MKFIVKTEDKDGNTCIDTVEADYAVIEENNVLCFYTRSGSIMVGNALVAGFHRRQWKTFKREVE